MPPKKEVKFSPFSVTSLTAYTTQVVDEFLGDKEVPLAPPDVFWKSELRATQYLKLPT